MPRVPVFQLIIFRDFLFIIMHVYKAGEEMVVQIWMKKRIQEEEEEEEEERQRKR